MRWSSLSPLRCIALVCTAVAVFTTPTTGAAVSNKGEGTVHGDLRTSSKEWPSLKLHFTLKRGSMQVYGESAFDVYANPVVSRDGLSVTYNGYADFNEGPTLTRYMLVDGVAYATTTTETKTDEDQSQTQTQTRSDVSSGTSSTSKCLSPTCCRTST